MMKQLLSYATQVRMVFPLLALLLSQPGQIAFASPASIRSHFEPAWEAGKAIEIPSFQEVSFSLPPLREASDRVPVLCFRARLNHRSYGSMYYLSMVLNGKPLREYVGGGQVGLPRILNRSGAGFHAPLATPMRYFADSSSNQLRIFICPGFSWPYKLDADKEEAFWYVLDISDLAKADGENILTLGNTAKPEYFKDPPNSSLPLVIADLAVGYLPKRVVEGSPLREGQVVEEGRASPDGHFALALAAEELGGKSGKYRLGEKVPFLTGEAWVSFKDGRTNKLLSPSAERVSLEGGMTVVRQNFDSPSLEVTQKVVRVADSLRWRVSLANPSSDKEAWVEVALKVPIKGGEDISYWDGNTLYSPVRWATGRKGVTATFPVSTVYTRDYGIAFGVTPETRVSYLENHISSQVEGRRIFSYAARFVVFPGVSEEIEFILYPTKPVFGYLDAIDGYYRRFAEAFSPMQDLDPRLISGTGSHYHAIYCEVGLGFERPAQVGRFYGTWDWGYAPFKRPGDWYGREEYWDWNVSSEKKDMMRQESWKFDFFDLGKFHDDRKARFERADLRANNAVTFYFTNWAEENLAREKGWLPYTLEPSYIDSWVQPFTGCYHIYPWASPIEETFRRDFPKLVEELDMSGFAYDCFRDTGIYRGKLDHRLPGWSYDSQGPFISEQIGQKELVDFIHSLHKGPYRMGVVANAGGYNNTAFTSMFAPDSFIIEGYLPDRVRNYEAQYFPERFLIGRKPFYLWVHSYASKIGESTPWRDLTPQQIRGVYNDYLLDMIEAAWHAGFTPCYDHIIGNELLVKAISVMVDVQMRGWEPVPACKGTGNVKRTRYGQGFGGAIVFTNPEKRAIATRETIYNEYIGEFDTLPVAYDGSALNFEVTDGKSSFNLNLGPRQTAIIEFPISIKLSGGGAASLTGRSSAVFSADRRTYRFNIESPGDGAADLSLQAPSEFELSEVKVNGKQVNPRASDDARHMRIDLVQGGNSLEVVFVSRVFKSSEEDLLDFVFTDGTESKAVIIVPDEEHERERAAAQMIQDYFFHYLSSQDGLAFTSLIKAVPWVKRSSDVSDWRNSVVIGSCGGNSYSGGPCSEDFHGERGIRLDKAQNILYIIGRDPFDTQQVTVKLLRLLDKKYPYFGKLPAFWGVEETREMMKKAGLSGEGFACQGGGE